MAGLLDDLFNPTTYDGQSGLLGRLSNMLASVPQSAGFPDQPASFADRFNAIPNAPQPVRGSGRDFNSGAFDTATYAPNQAQPIAIGNYMMPRLGSADLYKPQQAALPMQQAALPANAQPTQGQLPPGAAAPLPIQSPTPQDTSLPASLNPNTPGFMNFYQSMKNGGGLIGSIYAGLTGQRLDPRGIQQQQLQAQFEATRQALIGNGVDPRQASSTAMLAVLNPEAAKTVLPELLTNKEKYGVIREDPLEGKQYGFINERDQTINGKPINAQGSPNGAPQGLQGVIDKISAMKAQGATRQELLNAIPNGYREDVGALVSGKAVPANMGRAALRGPLNILAHAVDDTYDETQIPGRIQMRKDFMGEGKNGQAIGSFNTAQHHIDKLSDDLETLAKFHGNYPMVNSMKDWFSANANSNPQLRDTLQSVKTDMAAVSHEVANAYNAGHLSDHDMATWNALTNSALPPDQLRRGIADFVDLLNGKRDSLNHMYRQQFGEDAPAIEKEKNADITKKVHQRSPQYEGNSTSSKVGQSVPEGATATNPQTGQKIVFKGGKWSPLQ